MHFRGSYMVTREPHKSPKNPDFSVSRGRRKERVILLKSPWSVGQIWAGSKKIPRGDRRPFRMLVKLLITSTKLMCCRIGNNVFQAGFSGLANAFGISSVTGSISRAFAWILTFTRDRAL